MHWVRVISLSVRRFFQSLVHPSSPDQILISPSISRRGPQRLRPPIPKAKANLDHQQFASCANPHIYGHIAHALRCSSSIHSILHATPPASSPQPHTYLSFASSHPWKQNHTNNHHRAFFFPTVDLTFIHDDDILQSVHILRKDTETSCRAD